ncbi:peroxiredoxin [Pedobacter africanus]|uniref:Peroxiredoxin n=1 Tax=Pedobacter africanus TaxID=151894 RepID=A0ACC6L203_9SPHI|nr:TlpA disulfide reductase family protein [Pedobacter africanus]MDR6785384.1 peroxiredoxin [Pedobacter africanus]
MKKVLLLLCMLPFAGFAQQNFTINGKIKPTAVPSKAVLYYTVNDKFITDSTEIKDGLFTFKGKIGEPVKGFIKLKKKLAPAKPGRRTETDLLTFNVEPGNINIVSKSDSIKPAVVSGGEIADAMLKVYASRDAINAKVKEFLKPFYAAPIEQQKDQAFAEPFQKGMDEFKAEMDQVAPNFVRSNPDCFLSLMLFKEYMFKALDPASSDADFSRLSPRLRNSSIGQQLQKQILSGKTFAIGQPAPDFTQNDVNGKPVKLSDFRGKYVLVDFWASWCVPCRNDNPRLKHMYDRYKDKNFTVLGVSLDKPGQKEAWLKAIDEDRLTWTNVSDLKGGENEVAKMYLVQAIPTNFLIGPDGKILGRNLRGNELTKKLAELLGEIAPGK